MTFNIHDLITVRIDKSISSHHVNQIEFQIGYFKTNQISNVKSDICMLSVLPIENMPDIFTEEYSEAERKEYISNNDVIYFTKNKFGLEKLDKGYALYLTDDGMCPLNIILQMMLVEHGISMIHASAFQKDLGGIVVMPAFAEAGKTSLLGVLAKTDQYRFLGDDVVLLSKEGECLAYPRSIVLQKYHQKIFSNLFSELNISHARDSIVKSTKKFIKENIPFKGLIKSLFPGKINTNMLNYDNHLATVPLENFVGENNIDSKGKIEKIIFLQRYNGKDIKSNLIDTDNMSVRLLSIMHLEWLNYLVIPLTYAGFGKFNIASYYSKVNDIIEKAIAGKPCYILYIPQTLDAVDVADYVESLV